MASRAVALLSARSGCRAAPGEPVGETGISQRQVLLSRLLYMAEQDCKWRALPERFGPWHTIYMRLNRWAKAGVLERVLAALLDAAGGPGLGRAVHGQHDHPAAPAVGGRQAIGRSRGGWSSELHALAVDDCTVLQLALSPGRAGDAPWGRKLLSRPGPQSGRPALPAERACEGNETRGLARQLGYQPVIPPHPRRVRPWTTTAGATATATASSGSSAASNASVASICDAASSTSSTPASSISP